METGIVTCPGHIAARQNCGNDTSWHTNVDWTVKMSAYFRNASVAYSRTNGTILWHSFVDEPAKPVNLAPGDILKAYDALLLDTSVVFAKNGSEPPPFSSSTFATYLWMSQPVFSGQNATNPATVNAVFSGLQSLLAIPLYLCQNGIARRLIPMALDAKTIAEKDNEGLTTVFSLLSPLPERSSPATFASYRYMVLASTPTLIAYMILSGVTLVLCCLANTMAAINAKKRDGGTIPKSPKLSKFPALDLFTHCSIEDDRHFVVYQGRSGAFHYVEAGNNEVQWLSTLRVRWSGGTVAEDALQLVGVDHRHKQVTHGGGGDISPYLGSQESVLISPSRISLAKPRW